MLEFGEVGGDGGEEGMVGRKGWWRRGWRGGGWLMVEDDDG